MTKVLITEKQRKLIISSESAKEGSFINLYEFLLSHSEVTSEDVSKYGQLKNLTSYYDNLLNACRAEWEIYKSNPTNTLKGNFRDFKVICDLCGYKYLKIENRIQNKLNEKILVIGSECATEFGESVQGMIKWAQREAMKASKKKFLEDEMPGIRSFIENDSRYLNSLEIIVSEQLERRWRKKFDEIEKEYFNFIDGKNREFEEIQVLWGEKDSLITEIDLFIDANKNKKYIANKTIFDWLLSNNKHVEIKMIRENSGVINWAIAHRVYEPDLMKTVLIELNKDFIKMNMEILNLNEKQRSVALVFRKNNESIKASIGYAELILNHGGFAFNESIEDDFEDIYNNCKIIEVESQDKVIDIMRHGDYGYQFYKVYRSDNEILFTKDKSYILADLKKLLNDLKKYYFISDYSSSDILHALEKNVKRTMDERDYVNFKQAKELSSELRIR